MAIKKRLVKMALRKLVYLPKGADLFRYAGNRAQYYIHNKRMNPEVKRPISFMIELTNHCQLKCIICAREHEFGSEMRVGHMDFEQFKRLIDENYVYLDRIGLTGLGETLLYPKIVEAVDYINRKNKGLLIFLSTNAYQRNAPDIVREIAGKIDTLQISLDGIGPTFEQIRKKSKYDRYYSNLEKISELNHKSRMSVKFNMVVFRENYREMEMVIEMAKNLGVQEIYFNTFNLVANQLNLSEYDFYESEEFRNAFQQALSKADDYGIYVDHHDLYGPKGFRYCGYPWDDFYITWDGYSVPCCAKPFPKELNFGNVFTDGMMPVLNSPEYQQFRMLSRENETPEFCKRCHKIPHKNQSQG
jgi:radical SAM protein with 4Fe4S-binding SPASM domain